MNSDCQTCKIRDLRHSTCAAVASYTYDAFGRTVAATGPLADTFPHCFSTKYFDPETGLYYYGYRYYSPTLMRWLNRDPIEEDGGMNIYAFCKNNPLWKFDKDGRAFFAYRPLDGFLNPLGVVDSYEDDRANSVIGHEHLFFEDGKSPSNLGFFSDGTVKSDNTHTNYRSPHSKGWKDCIMRLVVAAVNPKPYRLLGTNQYNCQDWAEEVRRTYRRILRTGYSR